jgi:hypothetical protein
MTLKAPAVASTYIMTFPAATDTVDVLGLAQTFTATKTFTGAGPQIILGAAAGNIGQMQILGSTSGSLNITVQAAAGTPTWTAGTSSGTPVVTASAPLGITTATGNITCATCATTTNGGALSGTAPVAISAAGAISITGAAGQVLAGASPAFTATPTLGVVSSANGTLALANSASAFLVTIAAGNNAAAWTLTLPTNVPATAGSILSSTTGGASSWLATLPVANGGTNCAAASITCFNNITGFSSSGTTGTTSTNLVFSTSPSLTTPALGVATATSIAIGGATIGSNALAITGATTTSALILVDLNSAAPAALTGSGIQVVGANTANANVELVTFGVGSPNFFGRAAAGTQASPTAVQSGAVLMDIDARPYDGTAYATTGVAGIHPTAQENFGTSAHGAYLDFRCTAPTTTTQISCGTVTSTGFQGAIGATTRATGAFTTLSANGAAPQISVGASGVAGNIALFNGTTTNLLTLAPTASASAFTATFPANTGIIAEVNLAQSWSAVQTFAAGDISLTGATTGCATFTGTILSSTGVACGGSISFPQTVAGTTTSGGIPYFSSTTVLTSSALLTQYGVIYGGGAGAAPVATANGTTGQVFVATTSNPPAWGSVPINGTTLSTGSTGVSLNLGNANAFTAQQNFSPIATVTPSSSTITWALASQQVGIVTLGTATPYTMAAPSGIVSGGTYILVINQGSTGTQLIGTWNSVFKFPAGVKPTLSTATSSVDMITCVSPDGTNLDCVFQAAFQ